MIKVRVIFEISDLEMMTRIVQNARDGGHFYGGLSERSPRSALLARVRAYLTENGMPEDDPEEIVPTAEMIALKLWRGPAS